MALLRVTKCVGTTVQCAMPAVPAEPVRRCLANHDAACETGDNPDFDRGGPFIRKRDSLLKCLAANAYVERYGQDAILPNPP